MNLSISNIAWAAENDEAVYLFARRYGFTGIEIAPTKIFGSEPYADLVAAKNWADELKSRHEFCVCSMQSIWYGRSERLFGSEAERTTLLSYTKRAIEFAQSVGSKNLVFGCPKNRIVPLGMSSDEAQKIAADFFTKLAEFAIQHNTVISLEANPAIYGTNFVNTTAEAILLVEKINSPGFALNLDIGTMVQNSENPKIIRGKVRFVNHVHLSEPNLRLIERRELHKEIAEILREENYTNFVSIEMSRQDNIANIEKTLDYTREIFK